MNTSAIEAVREQAAHWAMRAHDGDLDDVERAQMLAWLAADTQHEREFLGLSATIAASRELPAAAHLVSLVESGSMRRKMSQAKRWVAIAATVVVAVIAGVWYLGPRSAPQGPVYATGTGESRTVTFEDGSVAYLNTRTRLEWRGDAHTRRVELLSGEALFDVARDASRPFSVVLRGSEIHVLGTRFNVYRRATGDVVVTVLEGSVRVEEHVQGDEHPAWTRALKANQQIVYRSTGVMRDVHETVALNAVKWRDGVLQLENESLPEVLEELTRYTDKRIFIRDDRLAEYRVGGAVSVRDLRAALARLEKLAPVVVTESSDGFALDYRPEGAGPDAGGDRASTIGN